MRTTLVLDALILEKAKKKSAEMGVTLSELTTAALRDFLFAKSAPMGNRKRFLLPVVGESESIYQDPQELARLRDEGR